MDKAFQTKQVKGFFLKQHKSIYLYSTLIFLGSILQGLKGLTNELYCTSTAYTYALRTFTSFAHKNQSEFLPTILVNSNETFSFTRVISEIFLSYGFDGCSTHLFLRTFSYLMLNSAIGLFIYKSIFKKEKISYLIICIAIIFITSTYISSSLDFPYTLAVANGLKLSLLAFASGFNYSPQHFNVDSTQHLNGLITSCFGIFQLTILIYLKPFTPLRLITLCIGGLINPITTSLTNLIYFVRDYVVGRRKLRKLSSYTMGRILECFIPLIAYLFSKQIWTSITPKNISISRLSNSFSPIFSSEYLNFIDIFDSHRNNFPYRPLFLQWNFPSFSCGLSTSSRNGLSDCGNPLSTISYGLLYVIYLFIIYIILNYIIKHYMSRFHFFSSSTKLIDNFRYLVNPILITLPFLISLDVFVKVTSYTPSNIFSIAFYQLYNQFYLSRLINILFDDYNYFLFSSIIALTLNSLFVISKKIRYHLINHTI